MLNQRLHLSGEFSGTHVVELESGVSLVTVAVRIIGNPNETTLNVLAGEQDPPVETIHSFPVGNPSPSAPYRAVFQFLATEGRAGIDASDGFEGDVVVYEAPADGELLEG
jgi:hypothetical protein